MEGPHLKALTGLLFVGVLMGALDLAIIGPALPAIQAQFDMNSRALAWLFNIYVLFQLVGTPLLAKLADRHGARAIYIFSVSAFALGSLLLVISPWGWGLLVARAVQGFGGAGIFPVAAAVIGQTFPPDKRGSVLGLLGAVFGLAFLIGPILGGLLLPFGWQWLFLINLPIAAALIFYARKMLPGQARRESKSAFDWRGSIALSVTLTALAFAVTNFDSSEILQSLQSVSVWPWLVGFVIAAPLFWRIEHRVADPIIRPAFFSNSQIRLTVFIALGVGMLESGTVFFPLLAIAAMSVSESMAAWLLLPGVVATTIASPLVGMLVDKVGTKLIIVSGLTALFAGTLIYGAATITIPVFIGGGIVGGIGMAAALGAPLRMILLNEARPEDRTAAQGLLNILLGIGQLLGAAIVGGVAASRGGGTAGYQAAFVALAVMTAALTLISLRLKSRHTEAKGSA